uniref:Uncharacterized protein n=1 Tax=Myotis myotis TaxID=51298 RepID=A0A7J7T715_MYOMY|nr:hypothetical protein mMyoMyo1_009259 [Myotis myotis]
MALAPCEGALSCIQGEKLLVKVKCTIDPQRKEPLPPRPTPPTSLSCQNLPPPTGILSSPSQPPAIPKLSPTLPLCFHFPLKLGPTNPTFSLEEPGTWARKDVRPDLPSGPSDPSIFKGRVRIRAPLTWASSRSSLRATLSSLDVYESRPSSHFPIAIPLLLFVLEPSEFNKNQHI